MIRIRPFALTVLVSLVLSPASVLAHNSFYLPRAATGVVGDSRFVTQISLSNPTARPSAVTMRFLANPGRSWTVKTTCLEDPALNGDFSTLVFSMPAGRKYAVDMVSTGDIATGWVYIDSGESLRISAVYGFYQPVAGATGFQPLWEAAVLPAASATELAFAAHLNPSDLILGVSTNTGYALCNPNSMDVTVKATRVNAMGQTEETQTFILSGYSHRSEFINELFKDFVSGTAGIHFRGVVHFSANAPIAGLAMRESRRDNVIVYSTVPVEPESKFKVSLEYDREPNSTVANAQIIKAPVEIHGTASQGGDSTVLDNYRIELKDRETVEVTLLAGSLGSTLHPVLSIENSSGIAVGTVANLFDGSNDQHASFWTEYAGTFYIRVMATEGTGLTTSFYRLFVRVH